MSTLSRPHGLAIWLTAMAIPGAVSAADDTSPWHLGASVSLGSDSNIRRQPSGQELRDSVRRLGVTGDLLVRVGPHQAKANASVDSVHFERRSQFDYSNYNLGATADLMVDRNLTAQVGTTSASSSTRDLGQASDGTSALNQQRRRRTFASATLGAGQRWSLLVRADTFNNSASSEVLKRSDNRGRAGGVAMIYQPTPDVQMTGTLKRTKGRFPSFAGPGVSDDYTRDDASVGASWATAKTSVSAVVGVARERHSQAAARDGSFGTGQLSVFWAPTSKLRLELAGFSDRDSGTAQFSDDAILTTATSRRRVSVRANWSANSRTTVTASAERTRTELVSSVGIQDTKAGFNSTTLAVSYALNRHANWACNWRNAHQEVNGPGLIPYSVREVACRMDVSLR